MESIPFIAWCLGHLNYWVITLLMAIESSFIPFPSEVVIPPAAYMAAATGEMSLWLIILCATLGALIGATVNYVLALEHGAIGTIVGRLVPAVRQLISIPAGLARMRFGRFLLYTAIGAGAWNCILGAIGYALASVVPYEQLDETVAGYSVYLKVLMLLVGLAAVYYLYRQYKK